MRKCCKGDCARWGAVVLSCGALGAYIIWDVGGEGAFLLGVDAGRVVRGAGRGAWRVVGVDGKGAARLDGGIGKVAFLFDEEVGAVGAEVGAVAAVVVVKLPVWIFSAAARLLCGADCPLDWIPPTAGSAENSRFLAVSL